MQQMMMEKNNQQTAMSVSEMLRKRQEARGGNR